MSLNQTFEFFSLIPHALSGEAVLSKLGSNGEGLNHQTAKLRLDQFGQNAIPEPKPKHIIWIFIHQFASSLIYILIIASLFSLLSQKWADAGFIFAIIVLNALIGASQEYSAQKSAFSLRHLINKQCRVLREGETYALNPQELVPGDILLLTAGDSVPADIRLLAT